jgi:hypothetical protein
VSDRTGWWNLYRHDFSQADHQIKCSTYACCPPGVDKATTPLYPLATEFGTPQWSFGASTYTFAPDERALYCSYRQKGHAHTARLCLDTLTPTPISVPFDIASLTVLPQRRLVCKTTSASDVAHIVCIDLGSKDGDAATAGGDGAVEATSPAVTVLHSAGDIDAAVAACLPVSGTFVSLC